jgi:hypothetical protein
LIGEEGASAKYGEALAPARRVPRSFFPEDEMLVRNPADAAESFLSIGGLIQSLDGADPKPSRRAIISRTNLPQQFDEHVWFDETRAVTSRYTAVIKGLPDTCPRRVKRGVDPRPDLPMESMGL